MLKINITPNNPVQLSDKFKKQPGLSPTSERALAHSLLHLKLEVAPVINGSVVMI